MTGDVSDDTPDWFDSYHGRGRFGDTDKPVTMIPLTGEVRGQTDKAIEFYDGSRTAWLPRSQVTIADDGTVSCPEWLAIKNGFA